MSRPMPSLCHRQPVVLLLLLLLLLSSPQHDGRRWHSVYQRLCC